MKRIAAIAATLVVAACSHVEQTQPSDKDKIALEEAKQFSKEAHIAYLSYWHDDDLSISELWKKHHPKNQPDFQDTSTRQSYQENFVRAMSLLGSGHVIRDNGGNCPNAISMNSTINPFSSTLYVTCSNEKTFALSPVKKVRWQVNEQ